MKFRRLISLLIIAVILIAFFTNPKEADFHQFVKPDMGKVQSAPLIEYESRLIYSNATVTYFNPASVEGKIIAAANKEKYIGVFGVFGVSIINAG
ncbi:hypothetical protein [Niabella ginsengisoli]|uniref:Uncharacterized protein n=1 Tax=Niabella ginsengisoli TaxID=522298 RepID=A0ABS9SNE3_9BACT|nr:hypothetical protein [Niabella ginsengisoli]MCH5599896.1 hypothetical protein [Niabella ginsengisoli]